MTDEEFNEKYQHVIMSCIEAVQAPNGGALFLLYPDAPGYTGYPVTGEPAFESEFRSRTDSGANPGATLVFIPW